jgi:6-phosphogluconolactonase (cycloisomerase 2 family)
MKKKTSMLLTIVFGSLVIFSGCIKGHDYSPGASNVVVGYLYTTINGEGLNKVVRFSRHPDGALSDEKSYSTNSNGGASVAAGGDAHGDFDAQGGVQIIGDYLLNVNAGGNTISVFALNKKTGDLAFKTNVNSGGTRPVSIGYTKKNGSNVEYWVVVGNQWNNPNVQKDGAQIERYPNNAFYLQDLTQPDASDNERTIQLFTFNTQTGTLTSIRQLDKYIRENGGPTTVRFSNDGTKLAVATWGIAHFNTEHTSLKEQHPSRVYLYDFADGNTSNKRFFEEKGIAGSIGFNWKKTGNSILYVSNFNLTPSKNDNSVTVLNDDGAKVKKIENFSATSKSGINESCWTELNATGDKLYVTSFQTNLVSTFNVNGSGLTFAGSEARDDLAPHGDSKELWISPDNKYLYNTGALQSYSINLFNVTGNSLRYRSQSILKTTAAGKGIVGSYNFLGLTGFDVDYGDYKNQDHN